MNKVLLGLLSLAFLVAAVLCQGGGYRGRLYEDYFIGYPRYPINRGGGFGGGGIFGILIFLFVFIILIRFLFPNAVTTVAPGGVPPAAGGG